jgi:enoyl-CoA hydratase
LIGLSKRFPIEAMSDILLHAREGHVVTLTINRPEKLNAMTKPLWKELGQTFEHLSQDNDVRCGRKIILTG